ILQETVRGDSRHTMHPRFIRLTLSITFLLVLGAEAQQQWPTNGWTKAAPGSMGVDEGTLANLDADIASGKYPLVDSMLVVRCGSIVYDRKYSHDYGKIYFKEAHTKGPLNA